MLYLNQNIKQFFILHFQWVQPQAAISTLALQQLKEWLGADVGIERRYRRAKFSQGQPGKYEDSPGGEPQRPQPCTGGETGAFHCCFCVLRSSLCILAVVCSKKNKEKESPRGRCLQKSAAALCNKQYLSTDTGGKLLGYLQERSKVNTSCFCWGKPSGSVIKQDPVAPLYKMGSMGLVWWVGAFSQFSKFRKGHQM